MESQNNQEQKANEQQKEELIENRELVEGTKISEITLTDERINSKETSNTNNFLNFLNTQDFNEEQLRKLQQIIGFIINEKKLPVDPDTYNIMMRAIQNREFDTRPRAIQFTPHAKKYMTTASIFSKILNLEFERTDIEESTKNQLAYTRYLIDTFYNKIGCNKKTDFEKFKTAFNRSVYRGILDDRNIDLLWNFLKEEKSGICYICNKRIESQMEIEHVLPFAFAVQYGGIGLKNYWQIVKKDTKINDNGDLVFDFGDKPYKKAQYSYKTQNNEKMDKKFIINNNQVYLNKYELLFSLLEVRESHKCCNQIKSACIFIEKPPFTNEYIPHIDGLKDYINEVKNSELYDCNSIEIVKDDVETINNNLINYFHLIATILNKIENAITEDVLTLTPGSQTQLNDNEKEILKEFYDIIRIASFEYIIPPHIAENLGKLSSANNMHAIQSEKFILKAVSNYSLNYKTYHNEHNEEEKIDYQISRVIWDFLTSSDRTGVWKEDKDAQWKMIRQKDTTASQGKVNNAVRGIFNGTNNFKLDNMKILDDLSKLYDNEMDIVEVKYRKGGEDKKFLKIVSLIFSRHVSNNILFPDNYEYSNFEKKIKNKSDSVKNILQRISINLFNFILYGFYINDDQFEEIIFDSPYNCGNITKDIFIETWESLLNSCELYEVGESILKLNEPYPISRKLISEREEVREQKREEEIEGEEQEGQEEEQEGQEEGDAISSYRAYILRKAGNELNEKYKDQRVRMSMFDHQKKIDTIDEAIHKSNDILNKYKNTRGGKKRNRKTRKSKR